MRFFLLCLLVCGCAAFTGDSVLEGPPTGRVETAHEHFGSPWPFMVAGWLTPLAIGRRTLYVANGTTAPVLVDVECSRGPGEVKYLIEPGHRQGFAEWDGECSLRGVR